MIGSRSMTGFAPQEASKFLAALALANRVQVSKAFKVAVLGKKFTSTSDTSQEIFDRTTGQDWEIDFSIVTPPWWKRWFSREIAFESPDGSVTLDRNKFAWEDLPALVNTIIHEAAHRAGYIHISATDYDSAPYGLGIIAEQVARELLALMPDPAPVAGA